MCPILLTTDSKSNYHIFNSIVIPVLNQQVKKCIFFDIWFVAHNLDAGKIFPLEKEKFTIHTRYVQVQINIISIGMASGFKTCQSI